MDRSYGRRAALSVALATLGLLALALIGCDTGSEQQRGALGIRDGTSNTISGPKPNAGSLRAVNPGGGTGSDVGYAARFMESDINL